MLALQDEDIGLLRLRKRQYSMPSIWLSVRLPKRCVAMLTIQVLVEVIILYKCLQLQNRMVLEQICTNSTRKISVQERELPQEMARELQLDWAKFRRL